MASVSASLRGQIIERAGGCCEYCLLPDGVSFYPHEIDHIIAEKHGGETNLENLALACWRCNRHKGTDIASLDPETGKLTSLFNPRRQVWRKHFSLNDAFIEPLTPEARVTVSLLQINHPDRLAERTILVPKGNYPPP